MTFESSINLGLPATPLTEDRAIYGELTIIYNALRILQQVLADAGISGGTSTPASILDVPHGGTGADTLTGILKGNGTLLLSAISSSTPGHVLKCNGVNSYVFGAPGTGLVVPQSSVAVDTTLSDTVVSVLVTVTGKTITLPAASTGRIGGDWTVTLGTTGTCTVVCAGADTFPAPSSATETSLILNQRGQSVTFRCTSTSTWELV